MHKFNKKFDASASWVYSTGNWTTLAMQKFIDEVSYGEGQYIEKRNNFKMPSYHRLDLSFNYYRYKKKGRTGVWNVSIYNAYSHHNSFLVMPSNEKIRESVEGGMVIERDGKPILKSLSIFPIIPSFSYTYKF